MFVEYMALKDKQEALRLLDAGAKLKPEEQGELCIIKEKDAYQAVFKMKIIGKKFSEQKWFLYPEEKGMKAKRERTLFYFWEILVTVISLVACILFTVFAFIWPDKMSVLIWLALVAFFMFLFVSWRKLFRPWVSLKIYLIRLL